jgi:hypothetical protein
MKVVAVLIALYIGDSASHGRCGRSSWSGSLHMQDTCL